MAVLVDLKVTELLCSRLCHDLISPVAAVNGGLELLSESDENLGKEAMHLIVRSGDMASRRLGFYRLAFGFAGGTGDTCKLSELRKLSVGYLQGGNVKIHWIGGEGMISKRAARLLLNLILLGNDALMRGGTLAVQFGTLLEGLGVALTARGKNAKLRNDLKEALSGNIALDALTARNVQGYFTCKLAGELDVEIEVADGEENEVRIAAALPT